jgi:hypothetical protein
MTSPSLKNFEPLSRSAKIQDSLTGCLRSRHGCACGFVRGRGTADQQPIEGVLAGIRMTTLAKASPERERNWRCSLACCTLLNACVNPMFHCCSAAYARLTRNSTRLGFASSKPDARLRSLQLGTFRPRYSVQCDSPLLKFRTMSQSTVPHRSSNS